MSTSKDRLPLKTPRTCPSYCFWESGRFNDLRMSLHDTITHKLHKNVLTLILVFFLQFDILMYSFRPE